jgi:hypothetical protein
MCVHPGEDGSVFAFADTEIVSNSLLAVAVEPSSCSVRRPPIWVAPSHVGLTRDTRPSAQRAMSTGVWARWTTL